MSLEMHTYGFFKKIHCVNNIWNITMCAYDGWACFIEVHTSLDEKF